MIALFWQDSECGNNSKQITHVQSNERKWTCLTVHRCVLNNFTRQGTVSERVIHIQSDFMNKVTKHSLQTFFILLSQTADF